ncbi:MAG: TIGR03619 family F420-dependent LLM class oxidoreductase [Dehalococcoidia bacterium]
MKVGVNLLNFGPGITPESIGRWGSVVEALGYHGIFISDHVAITPSIAGRYPEPYYDALITLSWLAGRTTRIDLGTTVIVLPYRHPILLAHHVANLDRLSGGRVILGVGVGNPADEFAAIGAPHATRGAWSNDALAALRALWTGSGEVTFRGRHVQFERVSAVATHQRPHPPIWVGGGSPAAMRRAARFDAAWHPINQPVDVLRDHLLPQLRAESERVGKPVPPLAPRIKLQIVDAPIPGPDRLPGTGTIEQIHADLAALEAMGSEYVVLDWYDAPNLEATRDHERAFAMLATLAERVIDLPRERVR